MVSSKLRLKNALDANQTTFGTFMALKGMRAAQVVAHTGLDAVIVDCEHGYIGDTDMHDMVSAVVAAGSSPLVRVRGPTGPLIKRALDTGTHGLIVPMVNNAEDARAIVSFAKFPPQGIRGQGSAFPCFEHGLDTPAEYVASANANVLTILQIESAEGLRNVNEICQVDGVDMIFIGPNDLAMALLGYAPAKYTEPVFLDAIETIRKAAKKHGKKSGILAADGERARDLKAEFDFIAVGTEVRAIQAWFKQQLKRARDDI